MSIISMSVEEVRKKYLGIGRDAQIARERYTNFSGLREEVRNNLSSRFEAIAGKQRPDTVMFDILDGYMHGHDAVTIAKKTGYRPGFLINLLKTDFGIELPLRDKKK